MRLPRVRLTTLLIAVALVAVNCAAIRWGLSLPNGLANGHIQPIVLGAAPTISLLALVALLAARDRFHRSRSRPFWLGFLACGSIALVAYVVHAVYLCPTYHHYSVAYEKRLNALLRWCGMTWDPLNPGGHAARYTIVLTGLVVLLASPQIAFAILGGWLAGRSRWRKPMLASVRDSGTADL